MKTKIFQCLSLVGVMFFLTACPYKSSVPVTEPEVKVKKEMMGKWVRAKEKNEEHPKFMEISKHDDYRYKIVRNNYQKHDSTYRQKTFVSHISKVGDNKFLNMKKEGQESYYLYKIEKEGNEIILSEVTNNIDEEFEDSEKLKAFVKKHMHLSFFYNKEDKRYIKQ